MQYRPARVRESNIVQKYVTIGLRCVIYRMRLLREQNRVRMNGVWRNNEKKQLQTEISLNLDGVVRPWTLLLKRS
jgi:hypothetical protein